MNYIVMAYIAMAYIVMAYIAMAYIVMAFMGMAYIVMAYMVMAYVVMAYTVMAYKRCRSAMWRGVVLPSTAHASERARHARHGRGCGHTHTNTLWRHAN